MSTRSMQMTKTISRLDFFLNKQKSFFKPCFNQSRCHGNSTHPNQNARINTYVVNLDAGKKWAPNHK